MEAEWLIRRWSSVNQGKIIPVNQGKIIQDCHVNPNFLDFYHKSISI